MKLYDVNYPGKEMDIKVPWGYLGRLARENGDRRPDGAVATDLDEGRRYLLSGGNWGEIPKGEGR